MDVISKLAHPRVLVGASLLAMLRHRDRPSELARFVTAVPLALLATKITKLVVDEHRPCLFDGHPEQSFPSGHSTAISAYALSVIASRRSWRALPLAVAAIAAVNVSRVRRREHWPIDVIVGDLIGVAGAIAGAIAARLVSRHQRVQQPAQ